MPKPAIATWKTVKKVVGSKPYVQNGQVTFDLPKAGVVKKIILRFAGTIGGSAFSVTAQPRPTARALGYLSMIGARPGHVGFAMKRFPAHMAQFRERVLYGVNAVEAAIAGAAGAFSLQLSISLMDPRIEDRGQAAVSALDLANYANPQLQIDGGQLIGTNGDNDNVALVGTATAPTITGSITLSLEMLDLPHNVRYMDNSFEYLSVEKANASDFTSQILKDSGLRMYDLIETVALDANGIETPTNVVPADQSSLVQVRADNNPIWNEYGPALQEDEMKHFFPSLTTPPAGVYILDHSKGIIGGLSWAEQYGGAVQYLDVMNSSAAALSATTLKMHVVHLTLNP